ADDSVTPDTPYAIITTPAVSADPNYKNLDSSDVALTNLETETADLQVPVASLKVVPSTGLHPNSSLVVYWDDTNTGDTAITGARRDGITIVTRATGQTLVNDTVPYDGTANGPRGGAGGSHTQQYPFTLPPGPTGAGQLQFTVTTNSGHQVFERNNNGTAE